MDIGKILKLARKRQGKTQTEVAQSCYVVDAVVSNYENGKSMPDLAMILKLCNVLNLTLEELKTGNLSDETDKHLPPETLDKQTLSATLKEFRIYAGLSQTDEAAQVFVTSQTVCKWESGATLPSFENLCRLSDLYATDVTVFFTGEKRKTVPVAEEETSVPKRSVKMTRAMSSVFAALCILCLASTAIVSAKYANARNDALSGGVAFSEELSRKEDKLSALEKELAERNKELEEKRKQLEEKNKLIEEKNAASAEKDARIDKLESNLNDLAKKLDEIKNLSESEVCTLTLKTPDGGTQEYYLLSGVTTTIKTGYASDPYCRFYENADGSGESYDAHEFTISVTRNTTLYAVYKTKWVDVSLAKTDEEREFFTSVEDEIFMLEQSLFLRFASTVQEKGMAMWCKDNYSDFIVKNPDGTSTCIFSQEIRRVEKEICDISALSELSGRLLKTAEYCDEFINLCLSTPDVRPDFPEGLSVSQKRTRFVSEYVIPQTEIFIPLFREICKTLYGRQSVKDFNFFGASIAMPQYGFYESYIDWIIQNGYWY